MNKKQLLFTLLPKIKPHPVIHFPKKRKLVWLDFSANNAALLKQDMINTHQFNSFVFNQMLKRNIGIGGFGENRVIYRRSSHYQGEEPRSVHLGFDIWIAAGTPVFTPLEGKVHSCQDNNGFGDYGPTIILEHQIDEVSFYTLYGHLSKRSLEGVSTGMTVKAGDKIAEVGNFPENGNWPPHLHFQVMISMEGYTGDFPGVAAPGQLPRFMEICLDPNLILQLPS